MTNKTNDAVRKLAGVMQSAREATAAYTSSNLTDAMIEAYDSQIAAFVALGEVGPIKVKPVTVCAWWDNTYIPAWVPVEPLDFGKQVGAFNYDHVLIGQADYPAFRAQQKLEWGEYAADYHPAVIGQNMFDDMLVLYVVNDGFVEKA